MKIFLQFILLVFSTSAFSQVDVYQKQKGKIGFHVDAGLNMGMVASQIATKSKGKLGFNAGIYVDVPIGDQLYLETGILYSQYGATVNSHYETDYSYSYFDNTTMQYVYYHSFSKCDRVDNFLFHYYQIPLLVKAITQNGWFASGGFSFSKLTNYSDNWNWEKLYDNGTGLKDTVASGSKDLYYGHAYMKGIEFGGIFKFGKYFKNGLGVSFIYDISILGPTKTIDPSMYYNNSFYNRTTNYLNGTGGINITYKFGRK